MPAKKSSPRPRFSRAARSLALACALAASGAATSGVAFAEPRADEPFQEGRKAMKANDWANALAALSQSYKLEPAPGTLLNVAECEMNVGQLATALEHFKQVEIALPAQDKRRNVAATRAISLAPRVPRLVVKLGPSAPPGTEVYRGDARIEPGATVLVNPGPMALRVTAPGRRERALQATAKESETVTVVADASDADTGSGVPATGPAIAPSSASTPTSSTSSDSGVHVDTQTANGRRTAGLVVGGIGVASLGVGVVTGILALGKASTVKDHCDGSLACDQQGVDAGSSGKTLSLVSTITVIAGVAGIGVGAYLFVTSKTKSPTAAATAIVPIFTPDFAGAALYRRF